MKTETTVNRSLLDAWIKDHNPDGLAKLAMKSKVSTHSIVRARMGKVPRSILVREALAKTLAVDVNELFPSLLVADDEAAS